MANRNFLSNYTNQMQQGVNNKGDSFGSVRDFHTPGNYNVHNRFENFGSPLARGAFVGQTGEGFWGGHRKAKGAVVQPPAAAPTAQPVIKPMAPAVDPSRQPGYTVTTNGVSVTKPIVDNKVYQSGYFQDGKTLMFRNDQGNTEAVTKATQNGQDAIKKFLLGKLSLISESPKVIGSEKAPTPRPPVGGSGGGIAPNIGAAVQPKPAVPAPAPPPAKVFKAGFFLDGKTLKFVNESGATETVRDPKTVDRWKAGKLTVTKAPWNQ